MEIESRLLPCGLHVVGDPPTAAEAIATLVNIAEIDRVDNDPPIAGLPGTLARSIGRNVEEIYLNNNKVRLPCTPCKELVVAGPPSQELGDPFPPPNRLSQSTLYWKVVQTEANVPERAPSQYLWFRAMTVASRPGRLLSPVCTLHASCEASSDTAAERCCG